MITDLTGLNEQQRESVLQSVDHNVVLLAGAGSGKTFTLVKRAEYLIRDMGARPESIYMMTFTRKAAGEMKNRICKNVPSADGIWVGTIHSLCMRLVKDYGWMIRLPKRHVMIDKERRSLIKKIKYNMSDAPGQEEEDEELSYGEKEFKYSAENLLRMIDKNKSNMISPVLFMSMTKNKYMKQVYSEYVRYCQKYKLMDFEDMILDAIRILENSEEARKQVHATLEYLMVDESQDTSMTQNRLLTLLAGGKNTMMVGDVNQSIYAFRNARPEYLENFQKNTPNTRLLKLERNYRSTTTIVEAANALISNNRFGTKVKMVSNGEVGAKIMLHKEKKFQDHIDWVISRIEEGVSYGRKYSDYAIINRGNAGNILFAKKLEKAGIPYRIFGEEYILDRDDVKDVLKICNLYFDPNDENAFRCLMRSRMEIPGPDIEMMVEMKKYQGITFREVLRTYIQAREGNDCAVAAQKILTALYTPVESLAQLIINMIYASDYAERLSFAPLSRVAVEDDGKESLVELCSLAREADEIEGMWMTVEEMLNCFDTVTRQRWETRNADAVIITTAHRSKGLEFETVFLPGVDCGAYPSDIALRHPDPEKGLSEAIEEERRLFYVAMTRAKKELYLLFDKKEGQRMFLLEIPEKYKECIA